MDEQEFNDMEMDRLMGGMQFSDDEKYDFLCLECNSYCYAEDAHEAGDYREYRCPSCGMPEASLKTLPDVFQCPSCRLKVREVVGKRNRKFRCPYCGAKFYRMMTTYLWWLYIKMYIKKLFKRKDNK
jgi:ribosomal protein L37AE/L43A